MSVLPEISDIKAVSYDYFPTTWQAVVWRNWGYIPASRIAKALDTTEGCIKEAAKQLGLPENVTINSEWDRRGFLTSIRDNWHLCTYRQILTLLDISEERLAFILKEDDFLWVKVGRLKPAVDEPKYAPLTEEQQKQTAEIRQLFTERFPAGVDAQDNAYAFIEDYNRPLTQDEIASITLPDGEKICMVYPYIALYGDALIDESIDPIPERMLAEYAKAGVNGIWLQGVLYQLVEFPFDPSVSVGWERRIRTLNQLVEKAERFGIGVYLYLNEPRSMRNSFFEQYPHLRGVQEGDFSTLCTSTSEVQEYLEQGMKKLFEQVPKLAGFFTITRSENLTNCYSHTDQDHIPCLRCDVREPWEVMAEVNNLMARGAHAASPKAKAIAWSWVWGDVWAEKVAALLTEDQIVQCTSEEKLKFTLAGIEAQVLDYSMSKCGPGEKAKRVWATSREKGYEVAAAVRVNNCWEMSTVPYLPVFDKVAEHITNLKNEGIRHLQASWTMGGCPSPNLSLVTWLMSDKGSVREFMKQYYGEDIGSGLYEAQKIVCRGFAELPFHSKVISVSPLSVGPMSPFYLKKTGYEATMRGYAYDDIENWRGVYPRDIFESQMKKVCDGFAEGLEKMLSYEGLTKEADEFVLIIKTALALYQSAYHHIVFMNQRGDDALSAPPENKKRMLDIVRQEMHVVQKVIEYRLQDSRIGYEPSNHYLFNLQELKEKMINLAYCEKELSK